MTGHSNYLTSGRTTLPPGYEERATENAADGKMPVKVQGGDWVNKRPLVSLAIIQLGNGLVKSRL